MSRPDVAAPTAVPTAAPTGAPTGAPTVAMAAEPSPWADAVLAAALLAVDPKGTAGVVLRARPGPARDRWLALLSDLLPADSPIRRVPLHVGDDRLLGGLDLAATLAAGRPVAERGILAEADGGVVLLAMAERLAPATAARLAAVFDTGEVRVERDGLATHRPAGFSMVALDEGTEPDERPPAALTDRCAIWLDLNEVRLADLDGPGLAAEDVATARDRLPEVRLGKEIEEALCGAALVLGVGSLRPTLFALRIARALAALAGEETVTRDSAAIAGRLVLAPRATRLPAPEAKTDAAESDPQTGPEEDQEPSSGEDDHDQEGGGIPDDLVLAAAQAAIPPDLLKRLRQAEAGRSSPGTAGRVGALRSERRRGRPVGTRRGDPRQGSRLNVIETLRSAAPWQALRRRDRDRAGVVREDARRLEIRSEDFRVTRFKQRSETAVIFVVDASGSSALNRLAEAKGAVELLLADCYARRDQVALIAFRGTGAEILLPPTRSLVRAKRCLASLPGGGGTPLAAGLEAALSLADGERRKGRTPTVVVLTDGRANVARSGMAGRPEASEDAMTAARALKAAAISTLLVDISRQPQAKAQELADAMSADYLALPNADAASLSRSVRARLAPQPGASRQARSPAQSGVRKPEDPAGTGSSEWRA